MGTGRWLSKERLEHWRADDSQARARLDGVFRPEYATSHELDGLQISQLDNLVTVSVGRGSRNLRAHDRQREGRSVTTRRSLRPLGFCDFCRTIVIRGCVSPSGTHRHRRCAWHCPHCLYSGLAEDAAELLVFDNLGARARLHTSAATVVCFSSMTMWTYAETGNLIFCHAPASTAATSTDTFQWPRLSARCYSLAAHGTGRQIRLAPPRA